MAETASLPSRWTLPAALLTILVAAIGNENAMPSYVAEGGRGQLWRCPYRKCGRVELFPPRSTPPQCDGGGTHDLEDTKPVKEAGVTVTDDQQLFT